MIILKFSAYAVTIIIVVLQDDETGATSTKISHKIINKYTLHSSNQDQDGRELSDNIRRSQAFHNLLALSGKIILQVCKM